MKTILTLEQRNAIQTLKNALKDLADNNLTLWFDPDTNELVAIDGQNIDTMEFCYFGEEPTDNNVQIMNDPDAFFNNKVLLTTDIQQIPANDVDIYVSYK